MTGAQRHRGLRVVLALFCLALVALVAAPSARAATEDAPGIGKLSIRKVDSTDPEKVRVSLIYNGGRADLAGLTIREDGKQVDHDPVVPLAKAGVNTAIVFAVDTSRSMAGNGGVAQSKESIREVVDQMRPGDKIGIVTFGLDVKVLSDLTSDKAALLKAVDDIQAPPTGRTAMWDGIRRAAGLFADQPELQPNMVVITDGYDDVSVASAGQARSAVTRAGAAVFAVAFNEQNQVDTAGLTKLVETTGGELFSAPKTADLASALASVQTSLNNQYEVTYKSNAERGITDLEVSAGGASDTKSFVPGAVAQGKAALRPPSAGGSPLPAVFSSPLGRLLAMGAIFVAVALAVFAIAQLVTKDESALDNVLLPYTDGWTGEEPEEDTALAQTAILQRAVDFTEDFAEKQGFLEKMEKKLEQANLPLRAAEAIFFWAAGVVVIDLLLLVLKGPFIAFLGLFFLAFIPKVILNFLGKRRQKAFNAQLPDMLQLLAGSLRAGYSLMQGVEAVSLEVAEPMGKELRRVVSEARLGRELEDALDGVGERMNSADFEWAVMAVRIQREVGGNLGELLLTVGDTMVARERMRREVAALTAEGKISAIVLGILPPALGVVMYVVNPNYMSSLFTESIGKVLLVVGVVLMLVGFAWMKKVITIEI